MCHLLIMLSNHQHYRAQAEKSRVWAVDSFLPSYQYTASIKACFFRRVIIRGSRPGVRWVRAGGLEVGDFPSPYQSSKYIFYGSMKPTIFQNILIFLDILSQWFEFLGGLSFESKWFLLGENMWLNDPFGISFGQVLPREHHYNLHPSIWASHSM